MSWDQLTVPELKAALSAAGVPFSSSDVRWKAQLVSLCEANLRKSHLNRELHRLGKLNEESSNNRSRSRELLKTELPSARTDSSRRRSRSSNRRGSKSGVVVRTAGRFSVPSSDDGIPTAAVRRKTMRTPSPPFKKSPPLFASGQSPLSGSAGFSRFPSVDPKGEPIIWTLRVSEKETANNRSATPHHTSQPATPIHPRSIIEQQEQQKQQIRSTPVLKKKSIKQHRLSSPRVAYRWGRILSLVVVLSGTMTYLFNNSAKDLELLSKSKEVLSAVHRFYSGRRFCDSGDAETANTTKECIRCPDNAICSDGQMECVKPQFVKQWRRGTAACVKDQDVYRIGYQLLSAVSDFLARQRGLLACGRESELHPDNIIIPLADVGNVVGFTRCSLLNAVPSLVQTRSAAVQLLFEELINQRDNEERYGVESMEATLTKYHECYSQSTTPSSSEGHHPQTVSGLVFYSLNTQKSLSCIVLEKTKQHLWKIAAVLLVITIGRYLFLRWKFSRCSREAIIRVIRDQTSVQRHHQSHYAMGPKVLDILNLLQGPSNRRKWFEWGVIRPGEDKDGADDLYREYRWIAKRLTMHDIERLCDQLVQSDASYCRSVMASDMTPFYYSKSVVDRIRLSN